MAEALGHIGGRWKEGWRIASYRGGSCADWRRSGGGTVKDWKLSDWIWGTSEEEERRVSRIASCLGGFCTDWRRRRRRRRGGGSGDGMYACRWRQGILRVWRSGKGMDD